MVKKTPKVAGRAERRAIGPGGRSASTTRSPVVERSRPAPPTPSHAARKAVVGEVARARELARRGERPPAATPPEDEATAQEELRRLAEALTLARRDTRAARSEIVRLDREAVRLRLRLDAAEAELEQARAEIQRLRRRG